MNHCSIARACATAPTWQPEYRLECEARALLDMPLALRRMELAAPARAGRRKSLEDEMKRLFADARRS